MKRVLAALAALLMVVLAACSSGGSASSHPSDLSGNGGGTYEGAQLDPAQPRPSFTLTDTAGKPFAFGETTKGHPTLLYFGYTHCPDICPETMANAMLALREVSPSVAKKTYVVFVTTDVKRDTGPVIKKWLSNFSTGSRATFVGLRGSQAQIDAAQASAHVTVAGDNGQQHSAQLLLYGPDDYARVTFLQSTKQQQQIEHDLPVVAAE